VLSNDDVLAAPGLVELRLPSLANLGTWTDLGPLQTGVGGYPPALDNSQDLQRLITWIRIRVPASDDPASTGAQTNVVLSWVGANAARVRQRVHVTGERLPDGTGEPDQTARLANGNVLPDSVALTVNGERWIRVDDLADAAPEVAPRAPRNAADAAPPPTVGSNAFIIDAATGEIRYNARPPRGAVIACSYDYGGGRSGDVGIGAIARIVNPPAGLTGRNPIPTWGAADGETVSDAEIRIPQFVRHREVAASREDFKKIVDRTPGVDVARSEILPLTHPDMPSQIAEGTVTVMVIPRTDPTQPEAPRPDAAFLQTVCSYLEPRRVLTTEVHIRGPMYRRIGVGIGIQAVPGHAEAPLADQVRSAVLNFLSPLTGGFDGTGWPLNKTVEIAEIHAAASRVEGVAKITGVIMVDQNGNALPNGQPISGLELPRVNPLRVAAGSPPSPTQIVGAAPDATPALPVPVVPENC
jgi:predicted phage baseplate assembly protein